MTTLPIQGGAEACPDCWTLPGQPHELSCREVSVDQLHAYLDEIREELDEIREERKRRMTIANRAVIAVVALAAILLLLLWGAR